MKDETIKRLVHTLDPVDRARVVEFGAKLIVDRARSMGARSRAKVRRLVTVPGSIWGDRIVDDITDRACRELGIRLREPLPSRRRRG